MCRLFGFRSVIQSQVHRSLVNAQNALAVQSQKHPDGWGIAYYVANTPHLVKGASPASNDSIFHHISGMLATQTVLAHIRKATVGNVNILNSHPFQHGTWVFAHNGEINNFDFVKEELLHKIHPSLQRFILGDTDSELFFYLFLSLLQKKTDIHQNVEIEMIMNTIAECCQMIRECADQQKRHSPSKLTHVITNGRIMLGSSFGKELHFSTYKTQCFERETCSFFSPSCESATKAGKVNHLLLSSEPLVGENVWSSLKEGQIVGVDAQMQWFETIC